MNSFQCPVSIGERVLVRRQRWTIASVQLHEDCNLVTLAGIEPSNALRVQRVIAPFESIEPLALPSRPRLVSARTWRRLCRAHLSQNPPAASLRTAVHAGIDLLPHQIEPVLAVLDGRGSRVLLADDVGLGKTVQAGLIITELLARGVVERVLALPPAGLREQWAAELHTRFHLEPTVMDAAAVKGMAAALPRDVNLWSTVPLVIASLDYAKRPEVLPALAACRWDLVLVDEAHNITMGTERFGAVHTLARLAPYVVLLTATPHNGDRRAFAALCNAGALPEDRPLLVFRRRRHQVGLGTTRHVHRLKVRPAAAERRMHDLLASFIRAVRRDRGNEDADVRLALMVLHKRSLSSARSVSQTIERRLAVLGASGQPALRQLMLPLDDPDGELDHSDDEPALLMPLLTDEHRERQLLTAVKDAADAASASESKVRRLLALLRRLRHRGYRAIVFTEYRDTLLHVREQIPFPAAVLHGGLGRAERRAALDDFLAGRVSILLATDAAGEGLNLQTHCHVVINLELPWSPTRLEQRIGRVDRIGQPRTVHVWHLLAGNTGELRLLDRLRARLAAARSDFDIADPFASGRSSAHGEPIGEHMAALKIARCDDEARHECDAVARARRLLRPGDDEVLNGLALRPAVAIARRRLRRCVGSRELVLMRATIEDGAGRVVAVHHTMLAVEASPEKDTVIGTHLAPVDLDKCALRTLDSSFDVWERRALERHGEFWRTRLAREDAIAGTLRSRPAPDLQPGLFDRRAEREHEAFAAEEASSVKEIALRRALAARASSSTMLRIEPVLVLVPPRSVIR